MQLVELSLFEGHHAARVTPLLHVTAKRGQAEQADRPSTPRA